MENAHDHVPQLSNIWTMQKYMIHRLRWSLAHKTPTKENKTPELQVINNKDPIKHRCPSKKGNVRWNSRLPHTTSRECPRPSERQKRTWKPHSQSGRQQSLLAANRTGSTEYNRLKKKMRKPPTPNHRQPAKTSPLIAWQYPIDNERQPQKHQESKQSDTTPNQLCCKSVTPF